MSHSCDETYDIYDEAELIARKRHECGACHLPIEPGQKYTRVFVLYDGRKENYKRCGRCQLMHEHLRELAPGERWPDEQLNCGQLYTDEWGDTPEWLAALAFWLPGEPLPAVNHCSYWNSYYNGNACLTTARARSNFRACPRYDHSPLAGLYLNPCTEGP